MTHDSFDYSVAGYKAAMLWLSNTGKMHLLENLASLDGWTVIAFANRLKEKENEGMG